MDSVVVSVDDLSRLTQNIIPEYSAFALVVSFSALSDLLGMLVQVIGGSRCSVVAQSEARGNYPISTPGVTVAVVLWPRDSSASMRPTHGRSRTTMLLGYDSF